MKHPVKRPFPLFPARRSYQVTAVAALVVATTTGVLLVEPDSPTHRDDTVATAAEPDRSTAASRHQDRESAPPASPPTVATTPPAPRSSSPATPRTPDADLKSPRSAPKTAAPKPPASKTLDVDYQEQTTFYYCGPAAARIALTAQGIARSQDDLARRLNTTQSGTNSAVDVTRVLNDLVGRDVYRTQSIPGNAATPAQMDRLQADVVRAVGNGYAVVVNVAGSATDVAGGWHSYPGGHYLTVVGYRDDGRTVRIADPANAATGSYWMSTINLAHWAATRGYSA